MHRLISKRLIGGIAALVGIAAIVTGVLADFGAPKTWIAAGAFVALAWAGIYVGSRGREFHVSEIVLAISVIVVAGLFVWALDLRDKAEAAEARTDELAAQLPENSDEPTIFDFVVYEGESDPESFSIAPYDRAYPRVAPESDAAVAYEGSIRVGSHVSVVCRVEADYRGYWYRLADGNFLHSDVVKASPHSGEGEPPTCPGSGGS